MSRFGRLLSSRPCWYWPDALPTEAANRARRLRPPPRRPRRGLRRPRRRHPSPRHRRPRHRRARHVAASRGFRDAVLFAANNMLKAATIPTPDASTVRSGRPADRWKQRGAIPRHPDPREGVREPRAQQLPKIEVQPFTASTLAKASLLFIGTFTAVDAEGKNAGAKEWYRVCLAMLDLRSGKIVSKGFARSRTEGVDSTPVQYFLDSPAWVPDTATDGYVETYQAARGRATRSTPTTGTRSSPRP